MGLVEEIKNAGLWVILTPLGYLLGILGFIGAGYGVMQMSVEFTIMSLVNTVVGIIMIVIGLGIIRHRDNILIPGEFSKIVITYFFIFYYCKS